MQARPHHRLPARLSSISVSDGASDFDLRREYIDMTKPGVQKPHWEPCAFARRAWTGCKPLLGFPRPETQISSEKKALKKQRMANMTSFASST